MLLPLAKSAYSRESLPEAPLKNAFFEVNPLNQEDQASLLRRAGLDPLVSIGTGPIRGAYRQDGSVGSVAIVVSGESLYKVTTAGVATQITGTISGTGLVRMAGSSAAVLISNGATLYSTDASTLSTISLPDSFAPGDIGYINGRFIVLKKDTHRYYWSGVGDTTFDALDYASAEMSSDPLEGIGIATDEVWFFGTSSTEVNQPTANPDAPFIRVQGRAADNGCASRYTIAPFANGIAWVGGDRKVYRAAGAMERISNSSIEEKLRQSAAADLRAWSYRADGHEFYVLTTSVGTFAHDIETGLWTEFTSYERAYFRGHLGFPLAAGSYAACDAFTGQIWTVDPAAMTDGDDPISMEFGAWVEAKEPAICKSVILDITVGSAALDALPQVGLRWSDNRGYTYGEWQYEALGREGQFDTPVVWRRLGQLVRPGRAFHFRITDAVRLTVRKAQMNERY